MTPEDTDALAQRIFTRLAVDANIPMDAPGAREKVIQLAITSMRMADIYAATRGPYLESQGK